MFGGGDAGDAEVFFNEFDFGIRVAKQVVEQFGVVDFGQLVAQAVFGAVHEGAQVFDELHFAFCGDGDAACDVDAPVDPVACVAGGLEQLVVLCFGGGDVAA